MFNGQTLKKKLKVHRELKHRLVPLRWRPQPLSGQNNGPSVWIPSPQIHPRAPPSALLTACICIVEVRPNTGLPVFCTAIKGSCQTAGHRQILQSAPLFLSSSALLPCSRGTERLPCAAVNRLFPNKRRGERVLLSLFSKGHLPSVTSALTSQA